MPLALSAAVTVGERRLRCDLTVSTGRLSGALRPDGAVPRPRSDLSSPALVPDQLAFLGLPASVPALPDPGPADPVRIRHHNIGHRCALHRRLVSFAQATNGCLSLFLDLIRSFFFYPNVPLSSRCGNSNVSAYFPEGKKKVSSLPVACPQDHIDVVLLSLDKPTLLSM